MKLKHMHLLPGFLGQWREYKRKSLSERVRFRDLYPCLNEKGSDSQSGKGHYFYQDIWALQKIASSGVRKHIDVGSRIDGFAGQCSAICEIEFVDIRPVDLALDNFSMREGSVLSLPYDDGSIESLSCLHVLEHIGLGRYGDELDPDGSRKAALELRRVLAVGGNLYIGAPIGRERVCFNAHRVFSPSTFLGYFKDLKLISFSAVNDLGFFEKNAKPEEYVQAEYSCGLLHLQKTNL